MPIHHARIITRLALALDRLAVASYGGARSLASGASIVLIGRVLFAAVEGPITVAEIARTSGLSRATVLRRLREMEKRGTVKRVGRRYCIDWEGTKRVYPPKRVRRAAALIKAAAYELAKLPEII